MKYYPFIKKFLMAVLILFACTETGVAELYAQYYNEPIYQSDINATAIPNITRIDPNIDFIWSPLRDPLPSGIIDDGEWAADWTGFINISVNETYQFTLSSDDGSWLFIDDTMVNR